MSAVKILALGSLVMAISVESAPGGSIRHGHPESTGRDSSAPTSLVFAASARTPGHTFSAQNLASSGNSAPSPPPSPAPSPSGSTSGLFLGLTGGTSQAVASPAPTPTDQGGGSLGIVSNGLSQSYSAPAPPTAPAPAPSQADAFINFGSGPYREASSLTVGSPQAFFNSPAFTHLYGSNGPSPTDIANFEHEVLSTIQSTYNHAGLAINLTSDPNALAAHTISVVSGASYSGNSGAAGITDVGNSGFSFIDKFDGAQSPEQLAVAIGHNISHELMHAFGISNHPEQSGPYVDAATASLQALSDPNSGFSPAAASLLSTLNFQDVGQSVVAGAQRIDGLQVLTGASTVPEPSTVALWAVAGGLVVVHRRRRAA
jgi:hypothetical protein